MMIKHSLRPRHFVKINGVNTSVANEKRLSGFVRDCKYKHTRVLINQGYSVVSNTTFWKKHNSFFQYFLLPLCKYHKSSKRVSPTITIPLTSINMFCVFLELFYYQISIFIRHGVVLYSQELLRRVAISVAAFEDILVPMPWQEKKIAYPTWWLFLVKRNTSKWLQSDKAQHCNTIATALEDRILIELISQKTSRLILDENIDTFPLNRIALTRW